VWGKGCAVRRCNCFFLAVPVQQLSSLYLILPARHALSQAWRTR
jgi:hypothetical protein